MLATGLERDTLLISYVVRSSILWIKHRSSIQRRADFSAHLAVAKVSAIILPLQRILNNNEDLGSALRDGAETLKQLP